MTRTSLRVLPPTIYSNIDLKVLATVLLQLGIGAGKNIRKFARGTVVLISRPM